MSAPPHKKLSKKLKGRVEDAQHLIEKIGSALGAIEEWDLFEKIVDIMDEVIGIQAKLATEGHASDIVKSIQV